MVTPADLQTVTVDAIMGNAARATLPFQEAEAHRNYGTAFRYNHLISETADQEVFIEYVITAAALTNFDVAMWTLRPDLGEPEISAENLLMMDFGASWTRLPRAGVAVMPAAIFSAHAERKGWRWTTDEITDGLAAREDDVATIGREPVPAYLLGHDVGADEERQQAVFAGRVAMDKQGRLRWVSELPKGCAGAPVFIGTAMGGEQFKLVCLGLVLAGEGNTEIATFPEIRREVATLAATPRRRWWNRRRGDGRLS